MDDTKEPIDETVFCRPEYASHFGGINEHTVLYYFAESQFFDETSNNAALLTQALYNQSMAYIRESRQAFEGALRTMSGLEFMLANEAPIPADNDVWIIKKQNRHKGRGPQGGDLVTVLATYYVVGESIYMTPSVSNVLQSKLLSITTSLNKLFSGASALPLFTPALGHTYYAPTSKPVTSTQTTSASQPRRDSMGSDKQSMSQESKAMPAQAAPLSTSTDARIISESFRRFLQYRNEYMDENPLRGEPGSFVLSSTKEHLQQQSQKSQAAKLQADLKQSSTPTPPAPPTLQLQTEALPLQKGSKAGEAASPDGRPKAKRRKSKAATSPTSPA